MNKNELDDIRRTLQRIQRIGCEPIDEADVSDDQAGEIAVTEPDKASANDQFFDRGKSFVQKIPAKLRAPIAAITVLVIIGAIGLARWGFVTSDVEPGGELVAATGPEIEPQEQRAISVTGDASQVTVEAESLLEAGRVSEVRRRLTDRPVKSAEVALILARSYDPNYLRLISNADAAADPNEAERWYRTWRDIATEKGLVLEPERFDRIIKAMR